MADPFSTQAAAEIQVAQSAQNAVVAINNLSEQIVALTALVSTLFPSAATAVVATATAGAGTLPAAPAKFLSITINGVPYAVPLYNP